MTLTKPAAIPALLLAMYSSFAAGDVFQFRAYNSLTGKEYLLCETTYEQLTASGVFNIE
ncbi:hypothetical protein GUD10_002990 [Salmonella enterica]|nr:hypothetical protein [Salmonella enterica subsp. arizonae serovar 51:z4,z23:-]EDS2266897.1 hypothetical protein [Salmonella enterica]EGN2194647.1 hypothetical protein [Salmonella enterica]EHJ9593118.1 hypothetical protein [Salmonella enterica]EHT0198189.1 hypothetical protein [Salmonella enterica]